MTALLTNKAYGYPTRGARRRKPTILACVHQTANAKATAIQERTYANRAGSTGPSATASGRAARSGTSPTCAPGRASRLGSSSTGGALLPGLSCRAWSPTGETSPPPDAGIELRRVLAPRHASDGRVARGRATDRMVGLIIGAEATGVLERILRETSGRADERHPSWKLTSTRGTHHKESFR